jgi:uncharacterized metal-binding protein YceD (DUF177 family)
MNPLKPYHLTVSGLAIGHHAYEYCVGSEFWENFPESEIRKGTVNVTLNLEKQERMLVLTFVIQGEVEMICDRCAYEYMQPIGGTRVVYIKFGEEAGEEADDVLVLAHDHPMVDISGLLYDFIHLMVPYHHLHPAGEDGEPACNPDTIAILEKLKPRQSPDPRWSALDKLKNGN